MTGSLRLKSLSDPVSPEDGTRILVTTVVPWGYCKHDSWMPELGPTKTLLAEAKKRPPTEETWAWYRERFLRQMRTRVYSPMALRAIQWRLSRGETITLLCYCRDERYCHRSLLRDLILGVG